MQLGVVASRLAGPSLESLYVSLLAVIDVDGPGPGPTTTNPDDPPMVLPVIPEADAPTVTVGAHSPAVQGAGQGQGQGQGQGVRRHWRELDGALLGLRAILPHLHPHASPGNTGTGVSGGSNDG
jgi:hypothetical protein